MKTTLTAFAALMLTAGIAAAETPGNPDLNGLVEAGSHRVTADVAGAYWFAGSAMGTSVRRAQHTEIGDAALFGLVDAGDSRVTVHVANAAGFTGGHGSTSVDRIFYGR